MDVQALLHALKAPDSPLADQLIALVVNHHLNQPLAQLVSEEECLALLRAGLRPTALRTAFEAEITPAALRILATLGANPTPLGNWVDPQVRARVLDHLADPQGPRLTYMQGSLSPSLLRPLLAPVFQDILLSFISRISSVLGASGRAAVETGLVSRMGREVSDRGRRWAEFGRSLVGGLGIEEKLKGLAEDFSQQAVATFRSRLQTQLAQPEGQAALRALVEHALDHLLRVPIAEVCADAQRLPPEALLALAPRALEHATALPLFETLLNQEVSALFERHGQVQVGELLARFDLLDPVRDLLTRSGSRNVEALLSAPEFGEWLEAWLRAANK